MSELKSYIVMVVGAVFTLLAPIQNFMIDKALKNKEEVTIWIR